MPDDAERRTPVRPVWRRPSDTGRTTGTGRAADTGRGGDTGWATDSDIVPVCSGAVVDVEQEYQRLSELKRRMRQDAEAEREAAAQRAATRHPSHHRAAPPDDEGDAETAAERWRNDRYAVKLLRQDDSVWAGGGAETGTLG